MAKSLVEDGLFRDASAWKSNASDSINKPQSKVFVATQMPSGSMLVENGLDQPYGGALVSLTHDLDTLNGQLLRYCSWRFQFRFPPETYANLARFENDIKICVKTRPNAQTEIRNVANFSTQWNCETGAFQIDHDPPGWVDSGYVPSANVITPDEWHSLHFTYSYDDVALTFSIESVQWDNELYIMPDEHKNIPMQETNWEKCCKYQLQNEGYKPGTVLVEYDDGVMKWSDEPIPPEVPE